MRDEGNGKGRRCDSEHGKEGGFLPALGTFKKSLKVPAALGRELEETGSSGAAVLVAAPALPPPICQILDPALEAVVVVVRS